MKKKGFTLVELLAVIVILAIIALIAVPQVLNMIEKARIGAAEDSAYSYVKAIEDKLSSNSLKHKLYPEGLYMVGDIEENLKGHAPSNGTFTLDKSNIISEAKLCINNYPIYYNGEIATYKKDGDYCIPPKKTLIFSSEDVEVSNDGNKINEIKIRENEEETIEIKTKDDKYIESITCTAGFEIKNLTAGPSGSSVQTITIKSTSNEGGICEIKTNIRLKTLIFSSEDVELSKDGNKINEIKIRENEEETIKIKTKDDKYIESVTCTTGFGIKNLTVGPSGSSAQTITIKSTSSENGTCEFKTHIRWYNASSYNASCTSYYGNGCIEFADCDDPDGNGGYISQDHCNYWWGRYTGHDSDTEPCTSADIFYSCSCPSGGKLSGSKCYSCPDGGTLDGTLCKY